MPLFGIDEEYDMFGHTKLKLKKEKSNKHLPYLYKRTNDRAAQFTIFHFLEMYLLRGGRSSS